jgi:hypothetical protein
VNDECYCFFFIYHFKQRSFQKYFYKLYPMQYAKRCQRDGVIDNNKDKNGGMPWIARKKSKSGIYHLIMRGINRQIIFEDRMTRGRWYFCLAGKELYYCRNRTKKRELLDTNTEIMEFAQLVSIRSAVQKVKKAGRYADMLTKIF